MHMLPELQPRLFSLPQGEMLAGVCCELVMTEELLSWRRTGTESVLGLRVKSSPLFCLLSAKCIQHSQQMFSPFTLSVYNISACRCYNYLLPTVLPTFLQGITCKISCNYSKKANYHTVCTRWALKAETNRQETEHYWGGLTLTGDWQVSLSTSTVAHWCSDHCSHSRDNRIGDHLIPPVK